MPNVDEHSHITNLFPTNCPEKKHCSHKLNCAILRKWSYFHFPVLGYCRIVPVSLGSLVFVDDKTSNDKTRSKFRDLVHLGSLIGMKSILRICAISQPVSVSTYTAHGCERIRRIAEFIELSLRNSIPTMSMFRLLSSHCSQICSNTVIIVQV